MSIRFAINGVGRIGRALIRVASQRPGLELIAVNDLADIDLLAPLLARDTLHGPFPGSVTVERDCLTIDGRVLETFQEADPGRIPWGKGEPLIVVDATGLAKTREAASSLLHDAVHTVLVSANADGLDLTVCLGVNHETYDPGSHHLLSAASCTTNCLAPLVHVLDTAFGLKNAIFNTVHSYNNDQRLLSFPHPDRRRAREAAMNMIPTTTSASHAVPQILPHLRGRIDGFAVRVPTPNVSLVDLVFTLGGEPGVDDINQVFREAAAGSLRGILDVSEEELVSSDFLANPHSAIVDLPLTSQVQRNLYRVVAWYDNEWGHASRLADLLELIGGARS